MIRFLLDTNVLVYLHDRGDPARRARAAELVEAAGRARTTAVPVQALTEFAAVALRKLDPPMDPSEVRVQVRRIATVFSALPVTPIVVDEALRGCADHRLPFFDAQIWAVARLHQIPVVLSEDTRPGSLDGVVWLNPFADPRPAVDLVG